MYLPVWTDLKYTIAENSGAGSPVQDTDNNDGTLSTNAEDEDVGDDKNTLTYGIESGNEDGAFAIDASTSRLTVSDTTKFNFEVSSRKILRVFAQDAGGEKVINFAQVDLTDVNEPPYFKNSFKNFTIQEASAAGKSVGSENSCEDPDASQQITYTLDSENNRCGAGNGSAFVISRYARSTELN